MKTRIYSRFQCLFERNRMEIPSIDILGIKVNRLDFNGTIGYIEQFIRDRTPRLVITLGTEMVMAARKNKEFRNVLARADIACADAIGIVWASRHRSIEQDRRIVGGKRMETIFPWRCGRGC